MAELQGSPLHSSAWLSWGIGTKGPGPSPAPEFSMAPTDSTPALISGPEARPTCAGSSPRAHRATGSVEIIRPFPQRPEFPWTSPAFEPMLPRLILEA